MIALAEWLYRRGRPNCEDCIEEKRDKRKIDCIACGKPKIMPLNFKTFGIIEAMSGIFVDGMGGLNPNGIRLALESNQIPKHEWNDYIERIITFMTTALKTQRGE